MRRGGRVFHGGGREKGDADDIGGGSAIGRVTKKHYLKNALPFGRAAFKKQGDMVTNALGTHTFRMQGKTRKHDLAINSDLLCAPEPLLKALVVHELAHFKEKDHNKSFYALCCHMEPEYHQLELDLRIFCVAIAIGENPYN